MKKKILALLLAVAMMATLVACGGDSGDSGSSGDGVVVTIFNSKSEIQSQFEEMAEEYNASHDGVTLEVYYSSDTVAAHMASKYSSNEPYVLSMVDAKDVYSLGPDHAIDLSDESYVGDTNYAITIDDQVLAVPFCIEGRGLMYNADAIEKITGETFDPTKYTTLDAFKELIDELKAGGMEAPCGVMKEDWSLAGHFFSEIYEEQEDVNAFVDSLYAGEADLANNEKFNSLMDTFDVLRDNNYAADSAIAAERETSEQKLASGEIAFMFGGNWDWAVLNEYEPSENMGLMPVPQNTDDGTNEKLVGGGSKYLFIDSSDNVTDEQRQAAKDFLTWLYTEEDGNTFLTETCGVVPAFSSIPVEGLDPLSTSIAEYVEKDALIPNYDYLPDDHYSKVGATMQQYLDGKIDRAGLAKAVEDYWSSTTPVER
ncbi:MAG TPA: carbohydrate ABC transporter substrate-binding protein [Candidatus Fimousia stercorigallinarum]|nr:carbohydrate ABC transporter substrate-binding protein [Candidatus Fimousia stercorigallinarum]